MGETSISVASPYILFLLIFACVEAAVVTIGFYYFRFIQPLRARPLRVVVILVIVLAVNIVKYYENVAGRDDCFRDIWLEATVGALAPTAFFWLAFRLFIIYSITKNRLEDRAVEGEDKRTTSRWTSILQPNLAKESTIMILWFSWVFIFLLVPLVAYLIQVAKGGDVRDICDVKAISYSRIIIIVITVILVCYMAYRLWNVHDGFWIKNELRAAAIGGLTVIPFYIANVAIKTTEFDQVVSIVFSHLNVFLITAVGIVPLVKAMKNYYHSSRTDSETSEMLESSKSGITLSATKSNDTIEEEKEEEMHSFSKHPKVAKLVKDPAAKKFLEEYIIHFQKVDISDYLIFWYHIRDFKALPKREFLTGKAYLLYSKYLKKDAYRFIPCIEEGEQAKMDDMLTKAMRASEPKDEPTDVQLEQLLIDYDFFDAVVLRVEDHLEEHLFHPFFKSKFYKEYRQAISLNTGLQTIVSV